MAKEVQRGMPPLLASNIMALEHKGSQYTGNISKAVHSYMQSGQEGETHASVNRKGEKETEGPQGHLPSFYLLGMAAKATA